MGVIDKLKNMMSGEIDDDEYMEYQARDSPDHPAQHHGADQGRIDPPFMAGKAQVQPAADKAVYRNRPAVCAGASGEV